MAHEGSLNKAVGKTNIENEKHEANKQPCRTTTGPESGPQLYAPLQVGTWEAPPSRLRGPSSYPRPA